MSTKGNPYFAKTIVCSQKDYTVAGKLKKMASSPGQIFDQEVR